MFKRHKFKLHLPTGTLLLGQRTLVMGVLNVTPDSFSDGGKFLYPKYAVRHALEMEQAGADILDIGGESTRPGSESVSAAEEINRILPILEALRKRLKIPISIDTQKSIVAEIALCAGAQIINDISGLKNDARIAAIAAKHRVPLILMHIRGNPRTMQKRPFARNVMRDVMGGLRWSVKQARKAGVDKSQIILDPGIGFGKSFAQNFELLQELPELARLGYPVMIGASRKGFLGAALAERGKPARPGERAGIEHRIWGTAATVTAGILGGAHMVRVHDVAEMAQVARVADCVTDPRLAPKNSAG
jgi:dihydropteroate synthase